MEILRTTFKEQTLVPMTGNSSSAPSVRERDPAAFTRSLTKLGTRVATLRSSRRPSPSPTTSNSKMTIVALALALFAPVAVLAQVDLRSHLRLNGTQLDLRGQTLRDADLEVFSESAFASVEQVLLARSNITGT